MIRVLVVDDSAYNRQTIKSMLQTDEGIEVIGIATDGVDAIAKTLRLKPDLITLDFEMPEMDGFSFLRWLMHERPTPVIMVSSYTNMNMAIKALEFGALDFIAKPTRRASSELMNIEADLINKVHAAAGIDMKQVTRAINMLVEEEVQESSPQQESLFDIVAIGSSTGGPAALQIILTQLPSDLPAGIVISQHIPKGFTAPLADRLNFLCSLNIAEASDGDIVSPGKVLICPGGFHMELIKKKDAVSVRILTPDDDKYVPSVDLMMSSAAKSCGARAMGIVLTGMGNDGAKGMSELHKAGAYTIAESEESAIVFGMPQEVIKAGAAKKVLSLERIAPEIRSTLHGERRR